MKLSDAIFMGRHLVKPIGGSDCERDGGGCALTMAMLSVGGTSCLPNSLWVDVDRYWTWLGNKAKSDKCSFCGRDIFSEFKFVIAHIFDRHVMGGEMTLEQLVDYVRSIEPTEEPDAEQLRLEDIEAERESLVSSDSLDPKDYPCAGVRL